MLTFRPDLSEQLAKLLDRKASVANDAAHRDGVDRVVARNGQDARTIAHYDMLPLAKDRKSGLFERSYCVKMIDARKLGQGSTCHFDDPNVLATELLVDNRQVFGDCHPNAFQGLRLICTLRPAARKSRN
jgi:hypothetical protein